MKLFTQLSEQGIAFQGIFIKEQGSLLRKKLYLEVYTDDDSQWENIPKSYEGFEVDTATPRD